MNRREALQVYVLVAIALVGRLDLSSGGRSQRGLDACTVRRKRGRWSFGLIEHRHGGSSHHESSLAAGSFCGARSFEGWSADVKFSITRDAGRFDCEGFVENGEGAGFFHFTADGKYQGELQSLGFGGVNEEKQYDNGGDGRERKLRERNEEREIAGTGYR